MVDYKGRKKLRRPLLKYSHDICWERLGKIIPKILGQDGQLPGQDSNLVSFALS